ncbi:MAG: 4,5-dihydroxyphthalate decarboxylase [Chloroflexi bacterium]|nr:4,5-dihydroxyphthalate decarboxylase [Chloroflexota bacterium]
MPNVPVTLATSNNFWTRAILDGDVTAEGIDLNASVVMPPEKRHSQMKRGAFDAAEFSFSTLIRSCVVGGGQAQRALPLWLNRGLRHKTIIVRKGSRITQPSHLSGGRIAGLSYGGSTNIWARQLLADDYGVDPKSVTWVVLEEEDDLDPSAGIRTEQVDGGLDNFAAFWSMLAKDEVDAVISPGFNFFYATFERFSDMVARSQSSGRKGPAGPGSVPTELSDAFESLIPETATAADYTRRTGVYPLIHTISIKAELAEQHPEASARLVKLFREAARRAPDYMPDGDRELLVKERELMGFDPYVQGWGDWQERTTATFVQSLVKQGLLPSVVGPDSFMVAGYREL